MKTISTLAIPTALILGCLSVESQTVLNRRGQVPPAVVVRINGKTATGAGEMRVTPAVEAKNLVMVDAERRQRVEIRGLAPLMPRIARGQSMLLRYEQHIAPDGRRVYVALLPHIVHLDWGDRVPVRKEILPELVLSQRDEPGAKPDVTAETVRETWLTVVVEGADEDVTLEGGETRTITVRGAPYRLRVYRSLRRDPGTNPRYPFEGERYLLTATLTPQP